MSAYQQKDADGWNQTYNAAGLGIGPMDPANFPLWLAKADTGQVHLWHSKYEMERNEPLWHLATHWKPAKDDIPSPPGGFGAINLQKRREDERRAYIQGFDAGVKLCQDKLRGVGQLNPNLL